MAGNWHRIGDIKGRDGIGVPTGGARGDVLKKEGGTDYATSWGAVDYADIQGKVPASALPEIGTAPYVVDSQAAMLNLPAVPGRQAIRTDIGATFVLAEEPASDLGNWVEMVSRSDVTSVNDKTGSVVLTKADVGLSEVNNTADSDKPVATQSVRGLMSSHDKTKLDGATSNNRASSIVLRDAARTSAFGQVLINDQPSQSSHTVPLGYLNKELESRFPFDSNLGTGTIDTVLDPGYYYQTIGGPITAANGYPPEAASAGVLLVTAFGPAFGTYRVQEWTQWSAVTDRQRRWIRSTNGGAERWSEWRELAGTELATSSRDGLMPRADKALLDTATYSGTPNALVRRNSAGRVAVNSVGINNGPSHPSDATRKDYVDSEITRISGGDHTYADDFTAVPERTRTVIVEGAPYGSPHPLAPGRSAGIGNYNGMAPEQVWKVEEEVLGLGYATQRWTLVSVQADHRYMLGFSWERTWIPGTEDWTGYTCVAGDTGDIISQAYEAGSSNYEPGKPWRIRQAPSTVDPTAMLYNEGAWPVLRREGAMVHLHGAFTGPTQTLRDRVTSNDGFFLMAFLPGTGGRFWMGSEAQGYASQSIQQGSSQNRWLARIVDAQEASRRFEVRAARYGPGEPGTRVWLPINMTWRAPVPVALNHANASDPDALPDPGDTGGDVDTPDPEG